MNRDKHIAWTKSHSLEALDWGGANDGIASLQSDLRKHPQTKDHHAIELSMRQQMSGGLSTTEEVREFIESIQ